MLWSGPGALLVGLDTVFRGLPDRGVHPGLEQHSPLGNCLSLFYSLTHQQGKFIKD